MTTAIPVAGLTKVQAMPTPRNYKAEYQRRIANAAKRGLSKSQARGHARIGEAPIKPRRKISSDAQLEIAIRLLRKGESQRRSAREAGVPVERFRRFLTDNGLATKAGRNWKLTDKRQRRMIVISNGHWENRTLRDFDEASRNGKYLNTVRKFLRSNDRELLLPFEGQAVFDAQGKSHVLETDPNILYELDHAGGENFEDVYKLIV